jgi:hypothetical protein
MMPRRTSKMLNDNQPLKAEKTLNDERGNKDEGFSSPRSSLRVQRSLLLIAVHPYLSRAARPSVPILIRPES